MPNSPRQNRELQLIEEIDLSNMFSGLNISCNLKKPLNKPKLTNTPQTQSHIIVFDPKL